MSTANFEMVSLPEIPVRSGSAACTRIMSTIFSIVYDQQCLSHLSSPKTTWRGKVKLIAKIPQFQRVATGSIGTMNPVERENVCVLLEGQADQFSDSLTIFSFFRSDFVIFKELHCLALIKRPDWGRSLGS